MSSFSQRLNLAAWYQASRPRTLTASYVPMGLAAVVALDHGVFRLLIFVLSLAGVLLLQTAANLINEYADHRRGADAYKEAGQGMTIKNRVLAPESVLRGALLTLGAGAALGLFLLLQSGPLVLIIGVGAVLIVVTYTAGPFPLAYNGLGELAAGIFMGPLIVIGAYYVMYPQAAGETLAGPALISLPITFTVAAILHANNIRDLEADRAVNKRTLAVIFGRRFARGEYMFLIGGGYVSQALLVLAGVLPALTLATLLTVPEALRLVRIFNTSTEVALMHQAQGRTARLHGLFGLLLAGGWLVHLLLRAVAG